MNKKTHSQTIKFLYNILFVVMLFPFLIQCTSNKTGKFDGKLIEGKASEKIIPPNGFPKFEFTKEIHKFGVISEGEIVVCDFFFKNIGSKDLVIKNVETSCGCTAVRWEKKPVKVGEESHITVEFNSEGRYGKQYKVITVFCNTLSGTKELIITAQVE
ncbi:DUF1573 domain-containing protein [Labilibaculum sp.]|uniref:DUF1573 domain-containing protein n=1 Tax=Labilibaculum sp. TaxID=2060723 RepID=UPI002AA7A937|nr:DUF1573 domain-containing protein [Labilibaculum sp.]MBN2598556.1 DUF1573 domain-containing protein [Marinifilaceae bacterium]